MKYHKICQIIKSLFQNITPKHTFSLKKIMNQNIRDSELSVYKVIVVGQSGVGKSNIVSRYVYDKFQSANNVTIGVQFVSKIIQIQNSQVNFQVWDTAGQQRFRSVNKVFYKNALGALIVFSLDSRQSFSNLPRWLKQIKQEIQEDAILILIGNKSDLEQREITVTEATKFAKDQNMAYIETSAALNINIQKAFQMLAKTIMLSFQGRQSPKKKQSIFLSQPISIKDKKKKKKRCCDS